jgi:hypothetical protein
MQNACFTSFAPVIIAKNHSAGRWPKELFGLGGKGAVELQQEINFRLLIGNY